MKNSFILYSTQYDPISSLTIEQKGKLLDRIFLFNSGKDENSGDQFVELVFGFFKKQFEIDAIKYEAIVERNRNNGKLGGRPKNPEEPKKPTGLSGFKNNPDEPKKADNDNDNVNVNVNEVINKDTLPNGKGEPFLEEESVLKEISTSDHQKSSAKKGNYGDPGINELLGIIKKYNNGICDGMVKEQRQYGKQLLNKLNQIDKVKSGEFTWQKTLEFIMEIISRNQYHSHKIAGPKKIYYSLSELMLICKQEHDKNKGIETF